MEAGLATPAANLKKVSWFNGCMSQLHVKLIALGHIRLLVSGPIAS